MKFVFLFIDNNMKKYNFSISVELSSASEFDIVINGKTIDDFGSRVDKGTRLSFAYVSDTTKLEIIITLRASVGTSALLHIRNDEGMSFRGIIRVLRSKEAIQHFSISAGDFSRQPEDYPKRYREIIKLGKEKKGFTKVVKEKNVVIPVFYLTNRNNEGIDEEDGLLRYGSEISDVRKGIAKINVPMMRKAGELNRPTLWKLQFSENPNKHFMLLSTNELDDKEFHEAISQRIGDSSQHDAFCFIHGYNSSFKDCVLRTAQIAYDVGFEGAPIAMSWPSLGTVLSYFDDEENVKSFTSHIVEFFRSFCSNTPVKKIHIIAHSMGNRALTEALVRLNDEEFFNDFEFNQIILAAPDVDATVFLEDIAPKLGGWANRMTLYASSADKALKASNGVHSSFLRLGESGDLITCCKGMDTVDASKTDPSMLGHGYFSSTAILLHDIFQLFNFNTDPADRNLKRIESGEEGYWRFR
jgi:esterase/lipase superfamily enzyme